MKLSLKAGKRMVKYDPLPIDISQDAKLKDPILLEAFQQTRTGRRLECKPFCSEKIKYHL